MLYLLIAMIASGAPAQEAETVGKRPYEMDWAGRYEDDRPQLVDFEDLTGWTVETSNSEASFQRTREQQLFGDYVGKLIYRGTGAGPTVTIRPPQPVAIDGGFDAVTCWIYGNNWGYSRDPSTPPVSVAVLLQDAAGEEFSIPLVYVHWKEWFVCHRRLSPEQMDSVKAGGAFSGFHITGGRNKEDRTLYFDSLCAYTEALEPLEFEPRPQRGIPMFPGQTMGTNTGPGKLPFPNRPETILPANLTADYKTALARDGEAFVLTYSGSDGELSYRLRPEEGAFSGLTATWAGEDPVRPCVDGGIMLAVGDKVVAPEKAEHLGSQIQGDTVQSSWRLSAGEVSAEATFTYRLWGKSLVIDTVARGGNVAEVRFGTAVGMQDPRLVATPYYVYSPGRPAIAVAGSAEAPLFLSGHLDWYLSNASTPFAVNGLDGGVQYNGGARYIPRTDGVRNDCYERFFITLSPRYEEVLPTVANPVSPWKHIAGTRVWRAHGAGNRDYDKQYWKKVHRYGMREVVVTDHETGWRDGGESFTFRTRPAPGKGGDEGQLDYSRYMQDELGFVYGPYNNYTDFAPVNEYWSTDIAGRTSDNQLQHAWMRCYAPKPARAIEYAAKLPYIIQDKFHFSTAYCDVHTAVSPWSRTDYDARVPGAGTFAATFYAYGEIMLHQKAAWDGPVYSEGGHHSFYCGLTDGNYGQDQSYFIADSPWLVDFDLLKLHDLCCNFGMGNPEMFYGRDYNYGRTRLEVDASIDRFLAATVAFGHPGFLTFEGGFGHALRSYYMLQQLHSRYCLASAEEIRYADAQGNLLPTTAAVASGAHRRSQVVTRYSDGTVTAVNGNRKERMKVTAFGRELDLPPNGYAGWSADGSVEVLSADPDGHRCDYAATPAYLYVDGRDRFRRFDRAAGDGIGICRLLPEGKYEVIPYEGADCGFAIQAESAVALDGDENELGPAELRSSRGLTYVVPVEGAVSYILQGGETPEATALTCPRDEVVAGETVTVSGAAEHLFQIPSDAEVGQRVWRQFENAWIDFTVVPLTYADVSLDDTELNLRLRSNLPQEEELQIAARGHETTVRLVPEQPATATIDLGAAEEETTEVLRIELQAGDLSQVIERGLIATSQYTPLVPFPTEHQDGMCLRGEQETSDFGETSGYVVQRSATCGDVTKDSLFMHPPYSGGTGYAFATFGPIELPARPAAFRAVVGKGDGSDLGDGIVYYVAVVDAEGQQTIAGEQPVTTHAWLPIEADLSPWAGQTVSLKLISDVGPEDNSSGDWASWAEMRIESTTQELKWSLDENTELYRRRPGPFPTAGLRLNDLRTAKQGWLRYDGVGLSGTGDSYGSFAVLNGIELGNMAPAGGNEAENIWEEQVGVALTSEAIASLGFRNRFELRNPRNDYFKVRRFWIELDLADGRKVSSYVADVVFTQPPGWAHGEGIMIPHGENIAVDVWFEL